MIQFPPRLTPEGTRISDLPASQAEATLNQLAPGIAGEAKAAVESPTQVGLRGALEAAHPPGCIRSQSSFQEKMWQRIYVARSVAMDVLALPKGGTSGMLCIFSQI